MTALQIATWGVGFAALVSFVRALSRGDREWSELSVALAASTTVASALALITPHASLASDMSLGSGGRLLPALALCLSLGVVKATRGAKRASGQGSLAPIGWTLAWLALWLAPRCLGEETLNLGRALTSSGMVNGAASIVGLLLVLLGGMGRISASPTASSDTAQRPQQPTGALEVTELIIGALSVATLAWITSEYAELYVSSSAQSAAWLSSVFMLFGLFGGFPQTQRHIITICGLFVLIGSHAPL